MTNIQKEIENRLNFLEIEQIEQDNSLHSLNKFETEVERLNNLLAQISSDENSVVNPETDFSHLRNAQEIRKLEAKLAQIDKNANMPKNDENPMAKPITDSYVICLCFEPESPTEWSETGWRNQGAGKCYSKEQAQARYQKLKQKWPHYPLEIVKR